MRGRRTQPRPARRRVPGSDGLALGHGAVGPGHPGTLHPATGPTRPGPLVVRAVLDVMAGHAGRAHLPGWVCPLGGHTPTGAPKLAAAQSAGNREAGTGIPGPEVGGPGGCGHNDPSHRPPMPGPGLRETVPRVAAQPPPMGGHRAGPACPHIPQGRGAAHMSPRAEPILPRPLGPPKLRPRRLTTVLWGRGGKPRPTAHGLGRGTGER